MQKMAAMAGIILRTVPASRRAIVAVETPSKQPLITAARKTAVPVDDSGTMSSWAFSRSSGSGVSCPVTAAPLAILRCSQGSAGFQESRCVEPVLDRGRAQRLDRREAPEQHGDGQESKRHPGPCDPRQR